MTPFLFMYLAPQFHFPFSGAVSQAIDPDVTWFQNLIRPGAGNARIERRAFEEVASYGKQLGVITEVLLQQVAQTAGPDSEALRKLRAIQLQIEGIKAQEYGLADQALVARVIQALQDGGPELAVLARQTIPAIEPESQQQVER
ncbi:hypothetical protein [Massilia sp. METH4]|uniref:hypothetical protein n=1 Tax=Massilia sp. METH4 TaxID=3123041 RepID=UPI0030D37636